MGDSIMSSMDNIPFGISKLGFRRKRYPDIITDMEARARSLFGQDVNLSERSPLGIFLRIVAWFISILWQLAEMVYNSAFVDTAAGVSLDKVGKYIGITRRPAERAIGEIQVTGTPGTIVPIGFLVAAKGDAGAGAGDDVEFETATEAQIEAGDPENPDSGTVLIPIRAVEPGISGNVAANTITEIINPTTGVDEVTNPAMTTGGRRKETDQEFRNRYNQSVAKGGSSTVDSIRASLLELEHVRAALVIVNNTMEADQDGRPPKSIECYLLGGDSEQIADAIFKTGAAGIQPYGQETQVVLDSAGNSHTIGFTYVMPKTIYVRISVTPAPEFPVDGAKKVRTSILQYIGGVDEDGEVYDGLGIGQGVIYHWATKQAMEDTPGIRDIDLELSEDGITWVKTNIVVAWDQAAETDWEKVEVTVV